MKRFVYLIVLIVALTLAPVISYADVNFNYVSCTIAASDTLADAGEGEIFDCTKVANSATVSGCADTATGLCRLSIMSSSCSNYTSCATSEIVTVKAVSLSDSTYTFTIKARDQETSLGGRTHSGVWDTGSKVQLIMTAGQMADKVESVGDCASGACDSPIVFNESGADGDFRIEGDTDANLFTLDAGQDNIGIGISPSIGNKLHIKYALTGVSSLVGSYVHTDLTLSTSSTATSTAYNSNAEIDQAGNSATADPASVIGIYGNAIVSGDSGTVTGAIAGRFYLANTGAGTLTNAYLTYIDAPLSLGTLTNSYGLYMENQSVGTNTYGIYALGAKNEVVHLETGAATTIGQVIKGAASQSANLQEWQASDGDPKLLVTSAGVLTGGDDASDTLTLQSTTHATKGKILFGTSAYDEVNNRLGIGTASPSHRFQIATSSTVADSLFWVYGTTSYFLGSAFSPVLEHAIATSYGVYSTPIFTPTGNITGSANAYLIGGIVSNSTYNVNILRGLFFNIQSDATYTGVLTYGYTSFEASPQYSGSRAITHYGAYIANQGLAIAISTITFTGSGLNDLTLGSTFTGNHRINYKVEIDATGTPDTFKWSDDGGSTWDATGVAITGATQTLNNGFTITFGATTGHTLGNNWTFNARNPITSNYGIYLENQINATNNYAIYSAGGANVLLAGTATVIPLTLKGDASQSADLLQIQNSSAVVLNAIGPNGLIKTSPYDYAGTPVAATADLKFFGYNKSLAADANDACGGTVDCITLPTVTTSGFLVITTSGGLTLQANVASDGTATVIYDSGVGIEYQAAIGSCTELCLHDGGASGVIFNDSAGTLITNVMFWYN